MRASCPALDLPAQYRPTASRSQGLIDGLSEIEEVAVAEDHALAVNRNGQVFTWGLGSGGKLGLGNTANHMIPVQIIAPLFAQVAILHIACGQRHSAAVASDGSLFTWGVGRAGQLGHGDLKDQKAPKRVEALAGTYTIDGLCAFPSRF